MNRDTLKQIIIEHRDMYPGNTLIQRNYQTEENVNYCFTGIRRCGKSYMMFQQIRNLQAAGIPLSQILYMNFEDERLLEMTADDLNTILEIALELAGPDHKPYLFLDEIQNVPGWEKFVRRVADMKYRISITGSNSRMLSSEIASTLGGRFVIMTIYPYSFREYLTAKGMKRNYLEVISTRDKADVISAYNDYVTYGAFPELVEIRNKKTFLTSIYQTVYLGDIITRNKITNDFALRLLLKKIAEAVMRPISFTRLTNILKGANTSIGKQTVINYIGCMKDSYLLFSIRNYASALAEKETSPKYYFMDTGLLGLMLLSGASSQIENLIAIELVRRYGIENVYFFERNIEVDFYVPSQNLAIQVTMKILDDMDARERETRALARLAKYIQGSRYIIITSSEEANLECDGIRIEVIPAWKWLLDTDSSICI